MDTGRRLVRAVVGLVVFVAVLAGSVIGAELIARRIFSDTRAHHPGITMNRLGFREHQVGPKLPNVYRIAIIGDSFTFGDGVSERDRFSGLLQQSLGPKYEVLNFGVRNNNLPDHLRVLERVLKLNPDFVVLQLYENDFETDHMVRPAAHPLWSTRVDRSLSRVYVTYHLATTTWVKLQEALGLSEEYSHYMARHLSDPGLPDAREALGQLQEFIARCRTAAVPTGFVLFPALWSLRPHARGYPFGYLHGYVATICSQEHLPCVDLLSEYANDLNPRRFWVHAFDAHPNAEANHRAAREILYVFGPAWHD